MYGLLAVCGALVLLGARGPHEPDVATLRGKTSKGFPVTLTVIDGEVRSLTTTASIYCPQDHLWHPLLWMAAKGTIGSFHQDDGSFRVSRQDTYGAPGTPGRQITVTTMRGRLTDDHTAARGTLDGHWAQGKYACEGTVRFSARESVS